MLLSTTKSCSNTLGTAFHTLESVGGMIKVASLDKLTDLGSAFGVIQTAGGPVIVLWLPDLRTLGSAFGAIHTVGGPVRVYLNSGLLTLGSAFESLRTTLAIQISHNPQLRSLGTAFTSDSGVTVEGESEGIAINIAENTPTPQQYQPVTAQFNRLKVCYTTPGADVFWELVDITGTAYAPPVACVP